MGVQINLSGHVWATHYWRFHLKAWEGSGDWQGSRSHYGEFWDCVLALGSRSRPEASSSHPSWGISFCSLMWATCCAGSRSNDQNLAGSDGGPGALSHCYHRQLLSFNDLAGSEWLVMFKMEACSPRRCQHWARSAIPACFLCQGRQLSAFQPGPDAGFKCLQYFLLNNCGNSLDY